MGPAPTNRYQLFIPEEESPEKFRPVLERLREALANPEVRRGMVMEDLASEALRAEGSARGSADPAATANEA